MRRKIVRLAIVLWAVTIPFAIYVLFIYRPPVEQAAIGTYISEIDKEIQGLANLILLQKSVTEKFSSGENTASELVSDLQDWSAYASDKTLKILTYHIKNAPADMDKAVKELNDVCSRAYSAQALILTNMIAAVDSGGLKPLEEAFLTKMIKSRNALFDEAAAQWADFRRKYSR